MILDASFSRRADRQALFQDAAQLGAAVMYVECSCPREIALERLASRWQTHIKGNPRDLAQPSLASDGRPELYQAQVDANEAFMPAIECTVQHMVVVTTQPIAVNVEYVMTMLNTPHLACCL